MRTALFALVVILAASPAVAQKITVKAATPNSGAQGAVNVDILIDGSGFGADSVAQFHVSGTTNPGGVKVNRTTRVSTAQVVANIDIDDLALLSYYDVKVVSNGRTGKGTDLFQVIQKDGHAGCDASVFQVDAPLQILPSARASLSCANGDLDCAFGAGGVTTYALRDYALVTDSDVDANGRVLVLAESHAGTESTGFHVLRFTADGALDTSFGTSGLARVTFTSGLGNESPWSLAVQPDGVIVVAGSVPTRANSGSPRLAAIARFRENGALDTSFGTGGKVTFSFGSSRTSSAAFAVTIQPDGRILIGGTADNDFAAARLQPNGGFDTTFGTGGRVLLPMGTGGSGPTSPRVGGIALQSTGSSEGIVIGGSIIHCTAREIAIIRLTTSGVPDSAFGARGDGRVFVDVANGVETIFGMTVDSAQRVILAGQDNLANHSAVVRLTPDGLLDSSFGDGGATRIRFDGLNTSIFNVTRDAIDRLVVTGGARVPGTMESDAFAARLLPDGSLDSSFGTGGALLVAYPVGNGDDQGGGAVVQPNGRIVIAGRAVFNYVVLLGLLP